MIINIFWMGIWTTNVLHGEELCWSRFLVIELLIFEMSHVSN
jgi:hypothetical protein